AVPNVTSFFPPDFTAEQTLRVHLEETNRDPDRKHIAAQREIAVNFVQQRLPQIGMIGPACGRELEQPLATDGAEDGTLNAAAVRILTILRLDHTGREGHKRPVAGTGAA